jgi:hypothetical protein
VVLSERLAAFRRFYRWLNLTLLHQATWPLALLLTSAPHDSPEQLPWSWWLLRFAGPALAAIGAGVYLVQRPIATSTPAPAASPAPPSAVATQARFLLLGLPLMVLAARLISGPAAPAAKLALFGVADVAAFHLIHFGVVARSYAATDRAQVTPIALFAVSWGIRDALLTAFGPEAASPPLAFLTGVVLGLAVALVARALQRWPGGHLPAAAAHWLVIYLIFGFVD